MNGIKLTESDEEKDLGVLINKSLKPASQCSEAARKANIILGSISRAFHYRDRYVFLNLYKTYVRPHLEFCTAAWSPWTEADSKLFRTCSEKSCSNDIRTYRKNIYGETDRVEVAFT